jgi:hypothetical protein
MINTRTYMFLVTTFIMCLSAVIVFLRGQDSNWDLLNYHHYSGYALLTGRYYQDIAAANMMTFFNPMVNIWSYTANSYVPFPFNTWIILLPQLLSVPVLVLIARELGRSMGNEKVTLTEIFALLLSLTAPLWWSELGTSNFSSTTAPLVLGGLYLLLRSTSNETVSGSLLAGAGALFGLAVGLKLTNAPYALVGALPVICLSWRYGYRAVIWYLSLFVLGGIGGFLPTSWWNWYLWSEWQSPVFPLYNEIFKSPYFAEENFRDKRWIFNSVAEVVKYLHESALGTTKSSELLFADARILTISVLLPLTVFFSPFRPIGRTQTAFLIFFFFSFTLWLITFAYQRYLIPIELLSGLVIWIFVTRLTTNQHARLVIITIVLSMSAYLIKVPDWGHVKAETGSTGAFKIKADPGILDQPAHYLVFSYPVSYILPSLHPDSRFYGIGSVAKTRERIKQSLKEKSTLPVRVLIKREDSEEILEWLARYDITLESHFIKCSSLSTNVGVKNYLVCHLATRVHNEQFSAISIDFSAKALDQDDFRYHTRGLSTRENWGQWSDAGQVSIVFLDCMSMGKVSLSLVAQAFGPNADKPFRFFLGGDEQTAYFSADAREVVLQFENKHACANELRIDIPEPTTPKSLSINRDNRKLGLGFIKARIFTGDEDE